MLTGLQTIDDWHHAVMQLASQLDHCHDYEVPSTYRTILSVLEQTFGQEQRLMEEFQFPAIQSHLEQHARVLSALHYLHPAVMEGDYAGARRAGGKLLPEWFQLHMATQDAALGVWVACCQSSDQTSIMDQLATAQNSHIWQLPQPHYSNHIQPHYIKYPARERIRREHIDPML